MQDIDCNMIKEILMQKDEKLDVINKKMQALYIEMETLENECIRAASLPGKNSEYHMNGQSGGDKSTKDLYHVLIASKRQYDERKMMLRKLLWSLREQADMINRIWICFISLDNNDFNILNNLYVVKNTYKQVEKESGLSHVTFERKRKDALENIRKMYMSNQISRDIYNRSRKKKKHSENIKGQLSLFDMGKQI